MMLVSSTRIHLLILTLKTLVNNKFYYYLSQLWISKGGIHATKCLSVFL